MCWYVTSPDEEGGSVGMRRIFVDVGERQKETGTGEREDVFYTGGQSKDNYSQTIASFLSQALCTL